MRTDNLKITSFNTGAVVLLKVKYTLIDDSVMAEVVNAQDGTPVDTIISHKVSQELIGCGCICKGRRLAVRRDDWAGLLAAACGVKKLERERGPYSSTNALLLRAMVAAEKRQNRLGLVAVAKAFAALGEDKVASMVLSRIGKNWVEQTNDSADIISPGCWDK